MKDMHEAISTDQVCALVELAQAGSIRAAARAMNLTEQGLRSRLISLEDRLGVELYRKSRGIRRGNPLTKAGHDLLPHARDFLVRGRKLVEQFATPVDEETIHVAASEYLTLYVLISAIQRFHKVYPDVRVQISTRNESEIESALMDDPSLLFGFSAPYEPPSDLQYTHVFSMTWHLVMPTNHPLANRKRVRLTDLVNRPLILFERGSTGREHIMDAFRERHLSPTVEMELTTTEIIVRMVEAGLGIAIVPLLPNGVITRNRDVEVRSLGQQIRPIQSGILARRGEPFSNATSAFIQFINDSMSESTPQP